MTVSAASTASRLTRLCLAGALLLTLLGGELLDLSVPQSSRTERLSELLHTTEAPPPDRYDIPLRKWSGGEGVLGDETEEEDDEDLRRRAMTAPQHGTAPLQPKPFLPNTQPICQEAGGCHEYHPSKNLLPNGLVVLTARFSRAGPGRLS